MKIKRFDYNTQYNIVINNSTQFQISDEQQAFKAFKSSESMPIEALKSLLCVKKSHSRPMCPSFSTKEASASKWPQDEKIRHVSGQHHFNISLFLWRHGSSSRKINT